jgi:hypothetical protein
MLKLFSGMIAVSSTDIDELFVAFYRMGTAPGLQPVSVRLTVDQHGTKMRWKPAASVAFFAIFLPVLVAVVYFKPRQDDTQDIKKRIANLTEELKQARKETPSYRPISPGNLDDLSLSAEDILRQIPGVAQVEVLVPAKNPTRRIVHIRDWHSVPKDLYAIDMANAFKRPLSQEEIDLLHQELLLEVELVQLEQVSLLRCLVKHHGLRKVFSEGLTREGKSAYQDTTNALRDNEKRLTAQLDDVRQLIKGMEGRENTDRYQEATAIEKEANGLCDKLRLDVLELGAPARLLIAGDIEEVLPLEDSNLLGQAKPVTPDGKMKYYPEKVQARRDGQVKAALENGAFSLIILGGSHDLSDSVRRLGKGTCEYIQVTTHRYQQIAGIR